MNQPKNKPSVQTDGLLRNKPANGQKVAQVWRPSTKAEQTASRECPYCHIGIHGEWAICPHCGHSLTPDKCSFCGAPLKPGKKFCTRCGAPKDGIACPSCGTMNARNFCRHCNTPLTEMGEAAQAMAMADPQFIAVRHKAEEMANLLMQIDRLQKDAETTPLDKEPERISLSEADQAMLNEYRQLLGSITAIPLQQTVTSQPPEETRRQYSVPTLSMDKLLEAYREKATEMNAALAAMVPPAEFTPEQQRDYYSARKVASIQTEYDMSDYAPTMWQCNLCGALHKCPSECAQPELGGAWISVTPEKYIQKNEAYITIHQSLNIE